MRTIIGNSMRQLAAIIVAAALTAGLPVAQATADSTDRAMGALASASRPSALYRSDGQALYQSDDGGRQWTKIPLSPSAKDGRITAIAVSAAGQGALYVAGPGLGVLKSIDAGKSWSHVDQGLPNQDVIAFATHSTVPDTLYAVVAGQGIYRSEDGGARWRMVDKGPQAQIRRLVHSDLEGSMQTGWLFAATEKGVYRSMDCFCGWRSAGNISDAVSAVAYDPKQPMTLYAASGRQVFSSANGGEEWQKAGSPGDDVSALAHSSTGILYALLANGRVVQSRDKGGRWE